MCLFRDSGYVSTLMGKRRHFPTITSSNEELKASAERQAFNTAIQGVTLILQQALYFCLHIC